MPNLQAIVALGRIAHDSVLRALGARLAAAPFRHGARAATGARDAVLDSYHCSRYNTNTGVLTPEMFRSVFAAAAIARLSQSTKRAFRPASAEETLTAGQAHAARTALVWRRKPG